jgi:hypothetical protein
MEDTFQNCLGLLEHVVIPEAHHPDSLCRKGCGAFFIMRPAIVGMMLTTIQLNRQLEIVAIKIEHVGGDGVLTTKLCPGHAAVAQHEPERLFGVGLVVAQLPREVEKIGREGRFKGRGAALTPALSRRERGKFTPTCLAGGGIVKHHPSVVMRS